MTINIDWDGVDEFTKALDVMAKAGPSDAAGAVFEEAEMIMGQAKRDTPVDTGVLRDTGHVKDPRITRTMVEVVLAYGTDYALAVHEIRDAIHPVGRSKFLQNAMNSAASGMEARLARRLKRRWKARWGNAAR